MNSLHVTKLKSYYDWKLSLQTKPTHRKKRKNDKKNSNDLGIPFDEFKKFVKLWKKKNVIF